jgi:uncharacterized protein (TIGR03085 family)
MTNWARVERTALVELLVAVGPDHPTLCAGWTTRDLAAHLVLRERRPDAAAGIVIEALAAHTQRVQAALAAQDWTTLLDQVRHTPAWSPYAFEPIDRLVNTIEYFVHHEDVRRAEDAWKPRLLDPAFENELWHRLGQGARLLGRRSPVGLLLRHTSGEEVRVKSGDPAAVVSGPAGELVLFLSGRQAHARVDIEPDGVAEELRTAPFGL